jgi:hypothetical protein
MRPLLLALPFLWSVSGCIVVADDPPPIPVYDPCFATSDCELRADACYSIAIDYGTHFVSEGMCSLSCRDDRDCPRGGACLALERSPFICYERCFDDLDCPGGFACIDAVGPRTFDAICLPY